MSWQHIRISRFGGPEVLELAELQTVPDPGPGEVRIKVLAAGTGFTDTFIRRGRYPDFKGPLPFTPGYDLVGIVEQTSPGVTEPRKGQLVADLCVIGGYAQSCQGAWCSVVSRSDCGGTFPSIFLFSVRKDPGRGGIRVIE